MNQPHRHHPKRAVALALGAFFTWAACGAPSAIASSTASAAPGLASVAPPAGDPRAIAIFARALAASGTSASTHARFVHVRATLEQSGLRGTLDEWQDLERGTFASYAHLGPASASEGFDGTRTWQADADGWPLVQDGSATGRGITSEAIRETHASRAPAGALVVTDRGERTHAGHTDDVVHVEPPDGNPYDLWIDRRTSLADREIESSGGRPATTDFGDYRDAGGGYVVPFVQSSDDGSGNTSVETIRSVTIGAADDATEIAMPVPPRDFSIDAADGTTTVPISIAANHVFVDGVYVNGKGPLRFILDSGGSALIAPQVARRLGIDSRGHAASGGAGGGSVETGFASVASLRVGAATLRKQSFVILPIDESVMRGDGVKIDGMLGFQFLERLVTRIDYDAKTMTLRMPGVSSEAPSRAHTTAGLGAAVPLVFDGGHIGVNASFDGARGFFLLDTGNRGSLAATSPFVRERKLAAKYRSRVTGIVGFGVGGSPRAAIARAGTLEIGPVAVRAPLLALTSDTAGFFADPDYAGNIGGGVLRRFVVTFDYANRTMYLRAAARDAERDVEDRSGIVFADVAGQFEVVDVRTNTPASSLGVAVGSRLVSIGGVDARALTLEGVRDRLRAAPGTTVRLALARGGVRHVVSIVLRDYV